MKQKPWYIPEEKWIEDLPSYLAKIAYQYLPLDQVGFHEAYRGEKNLILNSEWCRIRLNASWEANPYAQYDGDYILWIYYGRLHAPDDEWEMKWQGEVCECWLGPLHYFYDFIHEAFPRKGRPTRREVRKDFDKVERKFPNPIHWRLALEAEYWKHYTPELFYLFDLRRPELWEQYCAWLKARYIAEGRREEEDERQGLIPYYRVC
jgi:hypothetical protein